VELIFDPGQCFQTHAGVVRFVVGPGFYFDLRHSAIDGGVFTAASGLLRQQ
jgi:hypothetical protein